MSMGAPHHSWCQRGKCRVLGILENLEDLEKSGNELRGQGKLGKPIDDDDSNDWWVVIIRMMMMVMMIVRKIIIF